MAWGEALTSTRYCLRLETDERICPEESLWRRETGKCDGHVAGGVDLRVEIRGRGGSFASRKTSSDEQEAFLRIILLAEEIL